MSFERKYIQSDSDKHRLKYGDPVSIRFNDQETDIINEFMQKADIKSKTTAAKWLMVYGWFVLHGDQTLDHLSELFKKERGRK